MQKRLETFYQKYAPDIYANEQFVKKVIPKLARDYANKEAELNQKLKYKYAHELEPAALTH